jgi:predicted GIY-YIG superfamily endonuclease
VLWSALVDYPDIVDELIHGRSGVYALYHGDKLYYVGLASNLKRRLRAHLGDRHKDEWDRFSVYLTRHDEHMKELESLLLRIMSPRGNIQGGRFMESQNLNTGMLKQIRARDAEHRAVLLGKGAVRRGTQTKSRRKNATGGASLADVLERRYAIRGWHRGWEYRATLLKDGRISYGGKHYASPSAAAGTITQTRRNGLRFWHYRNPQREWAPIAELRR